MVRHDPRRPIAATPPDARRELRISAELEGVLGSTHIGKRRVDLVDLSCSGCRVSTVLQLLEGSNLFVTIPGLAPLGAQVRWCADHQAGLRFHSALHPMVIRQILSSRGPGCV